MAEKRKHLKMTPEEHAQRDETQRRVRERIAYHEAKAREEEQRRNRRAWLARSMRRLVAPLAGRAGR
jgi:hypothetical protein